MNHVALCNVRYYQRHVGSYFSRPRYMASFLLAGWQVYRNLQAVIDQLKSVFIYQPQPVTDGVRQECLKLPICRNSNRKWIVWMFLYRGHVQLKNDLNSNYQWTRLQRQKHCELLSALCHLYHCHLMAHPPYFICQICEIKTLVI